MSRSSRALMKPTLPAVTARDGTTARRRRSNNELAPASELGGNLISQVATLEAALRDLTTVVPLSRLYAAYCK